MKPLGMTAQFQIVKPDYVQDAIYNAVEQAIDSGWSVEQFRAEAAECWRICLREKERMDTQSWRRS